MSADWKREIGKAKTLPLIHGKPGRVNTDKGMA
jgi:hypothetical protein